VYGQGDTTRTLTCLGWLATGLGAMLKTLAARRMDADYQEGPDGVVVMGRGGVSSAHRSTCVARGRADRGMGCGVQDSVTVPDLTETLAKALARNDACVVVDLREMSFAAAIWLARSEHPGAAVARTDATAQSRYAPT
jgi:hypothetical protein